MVRKLLARPLLSLPSGRCSSDPGRLYPSGCQSDPYCSEVSTSDSEIQLKVRRADVVMTISERIVVLLWGRDNGVLTLDRLTVTCSAEPRETSR